MTDSAHIALLLVGTICCLHPAVRAGSGLMKICIGELKGESSRMFIEALQRDFHVCAELDCAEFLQQQPGRWNVVSIRDPFHLEAALTGARDTHRVAFDDVTFEAVHHQVPESGQLEGIRKFSERTSYEPLLVHCWAGLSRSTAVMLTILVRGLWERNVTGPPLVKQAVDALFAIRSQAIPNSLVLRLGLKQSLPRQLAETLANDLMQEPRILANRATRGLMLEEARTLVEGDNAEL